MKSVKLVEKVKPLRVKEILSRPIEVEMADLETAILEITNRLEKEEDWEV